MKEEALDRTIWRSRFGRGFGPVVRQNTEKKKNVIGVNIRKKLTCIQESLVSPVCMVKKQWIWYRREKVLPYLLPTCISRGSCVFSQFTQNSLHKLFFYIFLRTISSSTEKLKTHMK